MNKIISLFIIGLIISPTILAQDSNSFQVNGGIIIPMSSSKGLTTSIQYNYSLNDEFQFYIYSGFSFWDKFNVSFIEDYSTVQKQTHFSTFSADDHILIPIFIGSKINFHTDKFFTTFASIEIGFSHLSYNSYKVERILSSESGAVIDYKPDLSSTQKIDENLFGVGAGLGLSHKITDYMNLIFSFKLNSNFTSSFYKFLNSQGTYTTFVLGVNFEI